MSSSVVAITRPLTAVILAAGQGTRMRSALPKVLHTIGGKPLVRHVIDTALAVHAGRPILVHGHGSELLRQALADIDMQWAEQREQLGTGHAVMQTLSLLPADGDVIVLYGDVPMLTAATLQRMQEAARSADLVLLTVELEDPTGYGRIVRDAAGGIAGIVEHKDASAAQRAIREINTGIMLASARRLRAWLPQLRNDNSQREYYLTDIVALAANEGLRVAAVHPANPCEVMGVNDRVQLAELERYYQQREARRLMTQGVTLRDPARFDLRGSLDCGRDIIIDVNVVIEGHVTLGDNVVIGPNTVLRDSRIGAGTVVQPNCVIDQAEVGANAIIGPFARIRPETRLADDVHIGNFVEVKKSTIAQGSKVNHLSYIGDTEIGTGVNVGAGTITCNYDGANKHRTIIEDDVHIGSDTQLVAPVRIGRGATVGAGTTVFKDVAPGKLVINRKEQREIDGWQRPVKKK
ncbi:MAG: bifunctional UDP-N-acetylglucosamine diphosphorylase/glucosamine-1-phosphate N-acetyltransferase GlmU [Gammaproteobacteria bacterium]|nr:bifunctional UDP-N-acetylglucosamine diphosphorylase/glucosamine-1-phosphate N-acetyltransferase GlmU [Gammaproteobacteria bacterium]